MAYESPRRSEFTELVTHHVLRHVNRNELVAVVDGDRMADKVRGNHAGTGPSLDNLFLLATFVHSKNSGLQGFLDVRSFFK